MLTTVRATTGCEPAGAWPWAEPASAVSSLAFVAAGALIVLTARRTGARVALGVLTALVGVGSLVQHGPAPAWNPVAHDPPLMGALALVAADALGDLTGRRVRTWWWLAPTIAVAALAATSPTASTVAQASAAGVAVGASLLRARSRPALRRRTLAALALLAAGAAVGTLSRPGMPWCDPDGLLVPVLSGHAVWHVLAAAALAVLAPTLGTRRTAVPAE